MQPRAPRYDPAEVRAALAAQWARLVPALEQADPAQAVRRPGWDVARLGGHVTGTVQRLVDALDRPAPVGRTLSLAEHHAIDVPTPHPPYGLPAAVAAASAALAAAPPGRAVAIETGALRLT